MRAFGWLESDAAGGRGQRLIAGLAAVTLAIGYWDVIGSLANLWSTDYLYSYGFAVPFIAAYIWWTKSRGAADQVRVAPDYGLGIPAVVIGAITLVVGRLGAVIVLEQVSLIITLVGFVLLLLGRAALKLHWFAIAYLLLMIPLWNYPIELLQDPSRLLSTKIATFMLHGIGIPALRQGTNIMLPGHTLSVLRECSGVNQLIALTAMVLPATYLWLDTNARRIALLVFSVSVAYVSNGFRIALVGWLTVNGHGDGEINGAAHIMEGLVVSAVGYLAIGGFFSFLAARNQKRPVEQSERPSLSFFSHVPRRIWLDVTVLCFILGVSRVSAAQPPIDLNSELQSMDSRIGDWAIDLTMNTPAVRLPALDDDLLGAYPTLSGERRFTAVDDELLRTYRNSAGDRVQVYIGYYRRQEQGKELAGEASHALAWAGSPLTIDAQPGALEVNEIVRENAGTHRGVVFWYDIGGNAVRDIYEVKRHIFWDALTRQRSSGAVILIGWEARAGADADAARERAIGFAEVLVPVLRKVFTE